MKTAQQPAGPVPLGVVGASGYAGGELLRWLRSRSDVRVTRVLARSRAGEPVASVHRALTGVTDLVFEPLEAERMSGVQLAFVALPSGESMAIMTELRKHVPVVVDLGGDFRLPEGALFRTFYKKEHALPGLLGQVPYGLPELFRDTLPGASLVSNPGCYPTAAILALAPALRAGIVDTDGIVITALSGVSGAGRSSDEALSFSEMNENVRAYRLGDHQHVPEIESVLGRVAGTTVTVSFVPHIIPATRGIYCTVHARLSRNTPAGDVRELYRAAYAGEPFVRLRESPPELTHVAHTNFCDISVAADRRSGQLVVLSAIDNLVKGAAGQAIQNMNILLGIPETTGLV
jgi:N-acetyl-gamma-glutamyl-phosphate reductase